MKPYITNIFANDLEKICLSNATGNAICIISYKTSTL